LITRTTAISGDHRRIEFGGFRSTLSTQAVVIESGEPRALTTDAFGRDVHHETWRRVRHWRKVGARSDVHWREALQKFRRATFRDARRAMHNQVVAHPNRVCVGRFKGHDDARITIDIPQFLLSTAQMRGHQFVAIQPNPNDRDLRGCRLGSRLQHGLVHPLQ
jgi:hypothetical protein